MAPWSPEELDKIIARDLPGHKLVSGSTDEPIDARRAPEADAAGDDIQTLREKFLGPGAGGVASEAEAMLDTPLEPVNEGDQIVAVQPTNGVQGLDRQRQIKSVIVSGEGHVVGTQG